MQRGNLIQVKFYFHLLTDVLSFLVVVCSNLVELCCLLFDLELERLDFLDRRIFCLQSSGLFGQDEHEVCLGLLLGAANVSSVGSRAVNLPTTSVDRHTIGVRKTFGHPANVGFSVPHSVEPFKVFVDDQELLAITLNSMARECIENGHPAVGVLFRTLREGAAHLVDLDHVRFVLELEEILHSQLVLLKIGVTTECGIEELDVFSDCFEVLDALLDTDA